MTGFANLSRLISTWPSSRRAAFVVCRVYKHGPPDGGRPFVVCRVFLVPLESNRSRVIESESRGIKQCARRPDVFEIVD